MTKTVLLSSGVEVKIKKDRRAKGLRITVRPGGGVVLTMPFLVSFKMGVRFLESKAVWIKEKRDLSLEQRHFLLQGSVEEFEQNKEKARKEIEARLEHFQKFYPVSWNRLTIRNQKTRWGSCSKRGNLSFSYRIIFLPSHLRDYIVVHELCHLLELNHSPRFWALLAKTFPDYQSLRKDLHQL